MVVGGGRRAQYGIPLAIVEIMMAYDIASFWLNIGIVYFHSPKLISQKQNIHLPSSERLVNYEK